MKKLSVRYIEEKEYDLWNEFVENSTQGNIFNKSYWLKTVCEDFKILVCEENNKILGGVALPNVKSRYYKNPKLTPQLGILISNFDENVKYSTKISKEIEITNSIIEGLPKFKMFNYGFSYNFSNFIPFIWSGFQIGTRYTYVIEDLTDLDKVFNDFQYDVKYLIKKASKNNIVVSNKFSIEDFYEINKKTFDRQNMKMPYTKEFLIKLDNMLKQNNSRQMFFALNDKNEIVAGVYLIYDKNCTYYLMGGADPDYRKLGAQTILVWESIKFASQVSTKFDFEGSVIKSIESSFRQFGGSQKIIHTVYKSGLLFEFLYKAAQKNKMLIKKILRM